MPTLQLPDLDLYYEIRGRGPRLLLCNGSGASIEGTGVLVDSLAAHFEVLVHDQRGLGRTSVPKTATMADYATDAIALLDHVGWERTRAFGISFGGMVAQEIAVTVPDRIERLALLCTSAGGVAGSSYPLHTLAEMAPEERLAVSLLNLDTRFDATWLAAHPSDQALADMMAARSAVPKTDEQRRGATLQLAARAGHDVADRLGRITSPTLIACGQFDGTAPVANSEAIHARIPGSELRRYEGGHLFAYQDPRALPEIIQFLS